ncbi:MAG: hypothetical protein EBU33_07095 [Sphingobacteriia bacterium]|nr:hypothetical protein [Sphingobacteriia bacterium]
MGGVPILVHWAQITDEEYPQRLSRSRTTSWGSFDAEGWSNKAPQLLEGRKLLHDSQPRKTTQQEQ